MPLHGINQPNIRLTIIHKQQQKIVFTTTTNMLMMILMMMIMLINDNAQNGQLKKPKTLMQQMMALDRIQLEVRFVLQDSMLSFV